MHSSSDLGSATAPLIDTHAHLTSEKLADDLEGVMQRARDAHVSHIVTIASDLDDAVAALAVADRFDGVFVAVGVHPHAASGWGEDSPETLRQLAGHPRVVAIGETGLDFYYDNAPREVQTECFRQQIELARELDLPVVVHSRQADDETIRCIREASWSRGILHCFSGGSALMDAALSAGWYISFAGMITFPKWEGAELLRAVPLDRLLVETDSPYLAPVPFRGKRNEPAHVRATAARAAELRGADPVELAAAMTANAKRVYRIP